MAKQKVTLLKHLAAVDKWLWELEEAHGPIPQETLRWAAQLVDDWARAREASRTTSSTNLKRTSK